MFDNKNELGFEISAYKYHIQLVYCVEFTKRNLETNCQNMGPIPHLPR